MIEYGLLDRAGRRQNAAAAVVEPDTRGEALAARPSLSGEQQSMITALTGSGHGVEVVIGRAGAGKTYALDAARDTWERAGYRVIGTALAARAAAELQAGSGIASTTLDRLLADLDRPGPLSGLAPRSVVVVDEAGMVGTRKLDRLLAHAEAARAKVVLVGDPRQLPEIEAGGTLAALAGRLGAVELVDNRRQHHTWERAALAELRAGDIDRAVTAYHDHGRLAIAPTAEAARALLVDDWWAATCTGAQTAMYALRRSDVEDLNRRARHHMHRAGALGADPLTVAGREVAVGDRVVCLRNDRRLGVRNGTLGTVTAIDHHGGEITVDDATRLPEPYLSAGHVAHGYAVTFHKAQGATVDAAFVLGSDGLYREAGYVAMSRARSRTDLDLVGADMDRAYHRDTSRDWAGVDADPRRELACQLSVSQAQTLAADQHPQHLEPRSLGQLHHQRGQLLERIGTLCDHESAQAAWLDTHTPDMAEAKALSEAIGRRHVQLRRGVIADPPAWALDSLGPPPVDRYDRQRWLQRAEIVAAYRDTYQLAGPDALGPEPPAGDQHRDWDLARVAIREHERDLERHLDLDQGLGL